MANTTARLYSGIWCLLEKTSKTHRIQGWQESAPFPAKMWWWAAIVQPAKAHWILMRIPCCGCGCSGCTWLVSRPIISAESRSSKNPMSCKHCHVDWLHWQNDSCRTCIRMLSIILRLMDAKARLKPIENTTVWIIPRSTVATVMITWTYNLQTSLSLQIQTCRTVDGIALDFARSTLLQEKNTTSDSPKVERLECSTARQKVSLQLVTKKSSACAAAIHACSIAELSRPTCCACSSTVTEQIGKERSHGRDAKLTLSR